MSSERVRAHDPLNRTELTMDNTILTRADGVLAPARRNVLDEAHVGDIRGALGTVDRHAAPPRLSLIHI